MNHNLVVCSYGGCGGGDKRYLARKKVCLLHTIETDDDFVG